MEYAQPRICPGASDAQISLGFWDINGPPNLGQTTRPIYSQRKKRICRIVDLAVLVGHREKLKDAEKKNKYLELAR